MRPAALLLLGLLCAAAAYGLGYLLVVARIAPPVGRFLIRDAIKFFGFEGMYSLDKKGGLYEGAEF